MVIVVRGTLAFGDIHIPFWDDSNHFRKECVVTKLNFWTRDIERITCGDSTSDSYTFIGNPIIKGFPMKGKKLKDSMRQTFLAYFKKRSHEIISPYPVVARWRDDIHLTIASIADFQPHVTSGKVPPPANPLVISQPCIRLTDVAAVGRSGRHLSTFEMMAHHAFNKPNEDNVVYWIDQCVRYCDEMLIETFGISPNDITYVESARSFAERIIKEGGTDPVARINWALETALSRKGNEKEIKILSELQANQKARYTADVDSAKAFNETGIKSTSDNIDPAELASWSTIARTILNLHETITRH